MDVRPGGREVAVGKWKNGLTSRSTHYLFRRQEITDRRLVYAYEMHLDARQDFRFARLRRWPHPGGVKLKVAEQAVFLDGYEDNGSREHGTNLLMDKLDLLTSLTGLKSARTATRRRAPSADFARPNSAASLGCRAATAGGSFSMRAKPSLTAVDVKKMLAACEAKADEVDESVAIAIVDDGGLCSAFSTWTASHHAVRRGGDRQGARFRLTKQPTKVFEDRLKERPAFATFPAATFSSRAPVPLIHQTNASARSASRG